MKLLRSRRVRWLAAAVVVLALVFAAVALTIGTVNRRQADDPRSPTRRGAGALGQLLRDEGVQVFTTDQVSAALARTTSSTTLVVANGDRLSAAEADQLAQAPAGRLILIRPNTPALQRFGAQAQGQPAAEGTFAPQCVAGPLQLAGPVTFEDMRASYQPTGPSDFGCYPTGDGFGYLRAGTATGGRIDLVAGGVANAQLGQEGNAAWAMGVFGSQPDVVWLMAEAAAAASGPREPTLLPLWWQIAVVQAALALIVVGIWRGRRLGPILTEPLPVTVRASETMEGHGRMYYRLNARDRAAEALRVGARARLARAFGHTSDPLALSEAVGARTGHPPQQVRGVLFGPTPQTDDQLIELSQTLDRLEQEARQL